MDAAIRQQVADQLHEAARSRVPIPPLTKTYGSIGVGDAYEIQLCNVGRHLLSGHRICGHKVGLSSKAMQLMLGVDEPDYGHLLDTMFVFEESELEITRFI